MGPKIDLEVTEKIFSSFLNLNLTFRKFSPYSSRCTDRTKKNYFGKTILNQFLFSGNANVNK